jgi:exopolyphosphatase / guanosine-5'-triphosphate,3'-diphosphate pyrophosphatase
MPLSQPAPVPVVPPALPLRVAAIDVGSNAIRFLAAEFSAPGRWTRLDSIRAPVRLGSDAFTTGVLSPAIIDAAASAMSEFRARMEALGIVRVTAAGTSALREAENGDELISRVRDETAIELRRITGAEEARLVWLAIRDRLQPTTFPWLLVDLGGGSVEVSRVHEEGIAWSESLPLGTVRILTELRRQKEVTPSMERRMIEDQVRVLSLTASDSAIRVEGVVVTGGNAEALADLAEAGHRADGVRVLPMAVLRDQIATLSELTPRQRAERFGLRSDRADVILPAAIVFERVASLAGASELIVPDVGLKEGILLDLADEMLELDPHLTRRAGEVASGAVALGRRYRFDEAHARQVARLAALLFDQLQPHHSLTQRERRILVAAALLHDIGQFISYRRHHKHSQYLISHAELAGFSPEELDLVAMVARYHRRAEPRPGHEPFQALSPDERSAVTLLAALLRTADALDREHDQRVQDASISLHPGEIRLIVTGSGDLLPELWALKAKAGLLETVFERELVVGCRPA